jgi:hypothetical protein
VAVGGLAAVPALFLAGVLLDDESNVQIFDWHRNQKVWRVPEGPDDGKRLQALDTSSLTSPSTDVVLVVSCSYQVEPQDVADAFPHYPVVRLDAEEKLADRFWSLEKQVAFVSEFRDSIQRLSNIGVKRVHVVLAAPSSLSIRMGMSYDRRLHPELVVYQYERSLHPVYPWGLLMPSHGQQQSVIIETA